MCGIIGYLDKRAQHERPVGQVLLSMLQALSCRGPDSAGVAVFGPPHDRCIIQLKLPERTDVDAATRIALDILQANGTDLQHQRKGAYLRLEVRTNLRPAELEQLLCSR